MTLFQLADALSDHINPALVLLILEEPLLLPPSEPVGSRVRRTLRFWLLSLLSITLAVIVTETSKHQQWWHGHPNFPSGHMTFAGSAAFCLIRQRGMRWAYLALPVVALMGWSLPYGHWHTPDETVAALVPGFGIPWAIWSLASRLFRERRALSDTITASAKVG